MSDAAFLGWWEATGQFIDPPELNAAESSRLLAERAFRAGLVFGESMKSAQLEAMKLVVLTAESALDMACKKDKIGWYQESALQCCRKALGKE